MDLNDSRADQARTSLVYDQFDSDFRCGKVIGSLATNDVVRGGFDVEGVMSIDNGALRIEPLLRPGWGRAGVMYGPFRRESGLAFGVFMLNGHNTSQAGPLPDGLRRRMWRWWRGSETYPSGERILQWLRCGRFGRTWRRFRSWVAYQRRDLPLLDENLAVGWLSSMSFVDPVAGPGNSFVMHGTGVDSGELWAQVARSPLAAIRGVQNVQMYYLIVLRERGAAYYVASLPGAHGMVGYPRMRPVAVDSFDSTPEVFAGVMQSVLGQIGFRLDTRVYATRVARVQELQSWYGSAHVADTLQGAGDLHQSPSALGAIWTVHRGRFGRGAHGARSLDGSGLAILSAEKPSGLVHALISGRCHGSPVGLCWRAADADNHWGLLLNEEGCTLSVTLDGNTEVIAADEAWRLKGSVEHSIQILDDGVTFALYLDGQLMFGRRFSDQRLFDASGVGLQSSGSAPESAISFLEAHPRSLQIPEGLLMGEPWMRLGSQVVAADAFEGSARTLDGQLTSTGGVEWRRLIGHGCFELTGAASAKVRATRERPNPGRTAYAIEWHKPEFADLEVTLTPPGTDRGQGELCLCGFIFWQDPDNYVTVNIWLKDTYESASVSCFFQIDGFEDLYDAIWTNVGKRVHWGVPFTLRMPFDGERYAVLLNEEPVLSRALTDVYPNCPPLQIRRVGLVSNWEYGNDTGTEFRSFVARF